MNKEKTSEKPDYIVGSDAKKVIIDVNKWQGEQRATITIKDLIAYYNGGANDVKSMVRTIGEVTGYWKNIDDLAKDVLKHFNSSSASRKYLDYEAGKVGLKLI